MHGWLARYLYYTAQSFRGEPVARVVKELEASQSWTPQRLNDLQWERQVALVRHAFDASPFWRERLSAAGVEPAALRSRADWERIPPLEKREVQEHGEAMHARNGPKGLAASTSGSSGTPVTVDRAHLSWAHAHANVIRGWHWHRVEVGERYAYFWGVPLDPKDQARAEQKDRFFNRDRCSAFDLDESVVTPYFEKLSAHKTYWAFGYPSALARFAALVSDLRLDGSEMGWKVVITTAEVLHPHQRESIAATFGCPVVDSYGCAEAGVAGFECEQGGMHVPVESVVVDLLPAENGLAEILLTDLHNLRQPLIRYRVGDLVEPVAPGTRCGCGRGLPLLGRLTGRGGETLELPDGRRVNANLPSYVFKHHGKAGTVREYQFVQFPDGLIELRVLPGPAWREATADELRREVRQVLDVDVRLKLVERFERHGRGKHRDYVRAGEIGEG